MSNPAPGRFLPIIEQASFHSYPLSQVGERGVELGELTQFGLPLLPAFILPATFLDYIAQSNQLWTQLEPIWKKIRWRAAASITDASEKIQALIKQQHIPAEAIQVIFTAYTELLQTGFVAIKPSWILEAPHEGQDALYVKGEANLIESLLQVWASLYQPENLARLHQAWQKKQFVPAAFFVQHMVQSEATAISYSHTQGASDQLLLIRANWGVCPTLEQPELPADTFYVDRQTLEVSTSQLQPKKTKGSYQLDGVIQHPLTRAQQFQPALQPDQIKELARLTQKIVKALKLEVKIEWALTKDQAWIIRLKPLTTAGDTENHLPRQLFAKLTKLDLATESAIDVFIQSYNSQLDTSHTLRHQVVDTGSIYQQLHVHPYALLQTRKHQLFQKLLYGLKQETIHNSDAQCLYRLCNLTSTQLRYLKHGPEFEEVEPNPSLGYRGAIRLLHTHSLLDLEIDVIEHLAQQLPTQLGIILPFVRTASELLLLNRHITQKNWYQLRPLPIWCELATPAAIQQWKEFAQIPVAGVVLNFPMLHSLLYGIDPDYTDILRLYPTQVELLQSNIRQLLESNSKLRILVQIDEPSSEVLECLYELGVAGVIINQTQLKIFTQAQQHQQHTKDQEHVTG